MSEHLKLDKQLCFKIYKLNKTVNKLYAPLLKILNLTYPQYLVMLVMWDAKKSVSVKDICHELHLDTGTVSPLLKRIEALSFIKRSRNKQDERLVMVELTQKGKELKNNAETIPAQLFCSTGLTKNEFIQLQGTLENLLDRVKEHT